MLAAGPAELKTFQYWSSVLDGLTIGRGEGQESDSHTAGQSCRRGLAVCTVQETANGEWSQGHEAKCFPFFGAPRSGARRHPPRPSYARSET